MCLYFSQTEYVSRGLSGDFLSEANKNEALAELMSCVSMNKNVYLLYFFRTDRHRKLKKSLVAKQKFLFTLTHDLFAPPTLRFFSLRSKNFAGSQLC